MKKFLILAFLLSAVVAFAFADFTVTSVTGTVERINGNQRIAVKAGDTLAANVIINAAEGASLILRAANGRTITISGERNGTVAELTRVGVNIGGNVSRTNTDAVNRQTTGTVGGTARASDAAGDEDIAAE